MQRFGPELDTQPVDQNLWVVFQQHLGPDTLVYLWLEQMWTVGKPLFFVGRIQAGENGDAP